MKKNVKKSVTATKSKQNYKFPIYVLIEDGDEASIQHYKRNGVPVARISLPHRLPHYYAILEGKNQAEADTMNRQLNNWKKKDDRDAGNREQNETSYDALIDKGYDAAKEDTNPEEILAYKTILKALNAVMEELTEEKLRICNMVATRNQNVR